MGFWTSDTQGALPKWIFWLYVLLATLSLINLCISPIDNISTEHVASFLLTALTACLARINAVKTLIVINSIGLSLTIIGASIVLFATDRQTEGFVSLSVIMSGVVAYGIWWVWYLNLHRVKSPPRDKLSPDDAAKELKL